MNEKKTIYLVSDAENEIQFPCANIEIAFEKLKELKNSFLHESDFPTLDDLIHLENELHEEGKLFFEQWYHCCHCIYGIFIEELELFE